MPFQLIYQLSLISAHLCVIWTSDRYSCHGHLLCTLRIQNNNHLFKSSIGKSFMCCSGVFNLHSLTGGCFMCSFWLSDSVSHHSWERPSSCLTMQQTSFSVHSVSSTLICESVICEHSYHLTVCTLLHLWWQFGIKIILYKYHTEIYFCIPLFLMLHF